MGDLWASLKKHPAMLIGFIFLIGAVLYIVYKSSAANSQSSGSGISAGGQGSQLGGYLIYNEEVVNPTPININNYGSNPKPGHVTHIKSNIPILKNSPNLGHNQRPLIGYSNGAKIPVGAQGGNLTYGGKTWHTWWGYGRKNSGILWGNTGPNQKQTLLYAPKGAKIS